MVEVSTAFRAHSTRALRKRGLLGDYVTVRVDGRGALLEGSSGGGLQLDPADVRLMRIGFVESNRRKHFSVRLWLPDGKLELEADQTQYAAYAAAMRQWAAAMRAVGQGARVEGGASVFSAVIWPIMMGLVALAAMGVSIFVLTNEPWWGRLIVPLLPTALTALGVWLAVRYHWPRRIEDPSELDRQLPPS